MLHLYKVEGIARHAGTDLDGSEWYEQFLGEMEDSAFESLFECETCPSCDGDITDLDERDKCPHCGTTMYEHLMPTCGECGKRILSCDAFFCLDDGDSYVCERCVELHDPVVIDWDNVTAGFAVIAQDAKLGLERDADGQLPSYAWPGGYPLFYLDKRGNVYCPSCASQVTCDYYTDSIEACDANYEDTDLYCDGCSTRIESAYAED